MHIAEVVTIAKSLPLLRLNTYKSLILSYSADYRRILRKNIVILQSNQNIRSMKADLIIGRDKEKAELQRCIEYFHH